MNNAKLVFPAIIIVIITIMIGIIAINQESSPKEIESSLDEKITSDYDITSEVQEKIDEIKKAKEENEYSPKDREWLTSGPFQIDRSEYVLGEKIFLRIGSLPDDSKGQVVFLRPLNTTHNSVYITVPFDAAKKSAFNYYVEPQLSKNRGLCTVDDVIGEWTVVFRGTNYPNLKFEITENMLPGTEDSFQPVC